MAHLKISKSIMVPNMLYFHPKWLDEKFYNLAGAVILDLRPTEKSNLKDFQYFGEKKLRVIDPLVVVSRVVEQLDMGHSEHLTL